MQQQQQQQQQKRWVAPQSVPTPHLGRPPRRQRCHPPSSRSHRTPHGPQTTGWSHGQRCSGCCPVEAGMRGPWQGRGRQISDEENPGAFMAGARVPDPAPCKHTGSGLSSRACQGMQQGGLATADAQRAGAAALAVGKACRPHCHKSLLPGDVRQHTSSTLMAADTAASASPPASTAAPALQAAARSARRKG